MGICQSLPSCISQAVKKNQLSVRLEQNNLTYHLGQTAGCDNVTSMNEPVKMPGRLLNGFSHLIVAIKVEYVCDQVESILVVLNLCIEACEVESVGKVVFVDLAEVLVATGRDELEMDLSADGQGMLY